MTRYLNFQLRQSKFDSCVAVTNLGQVVSLCTASVHSGVSLGTWLKTVVDICVQTFSRAWLDASQRSRDFVCLNGSSREESVTF